MQLFWTFRGFRRFVGRVSLSAELDGMAQRPRKPVLHGVLLNHCFFDQRSDRLTQLEGFTKLCMNHPIENHLLMRLRPILSGIRVKLRG